MRKFALPLAVCVLLLVFVVARAADPTRKINLPTSKTLSLPVPGYLARTNSFPATIALSPDGRYAALLNMGFGTQESGGRQSIAILELGNSQLHDFPDDRLGQDAHQSYFLGLAFSSDGSHLYASIGSITDPTGKKPGDTGNGIAMYKFAQGQVTPERFIKIPPQHLAAGKAVAHALRNTPPGTAIPYPAGFAVLPPRLEPEPRAPSPVPAAGDRLLVANNLSDNVVLLDVNSGQILKSFDLSRSRYVPAAYPYAVIVNKAGTRAFCSLWNSSGVALLDLVKGSVDFITMLKTGGPTAPGSHPTAMALSPDERTLYVALSNSDTVVSFDVIGVPIGSKKIPHLSHAYHTNPADLPDHGSTPQAVALSSDGSRLFVASASSDAVAVWDALTHDHEPRPLGFLPTPWYPTALAVAGNDLLIATAKGEGSGPNNMKATLEGPQHHRQHPYIPTLVGGSIQRISLADIDENLGAYTKQVEDDNLLRADPAKLTFSGGKNPIRHVIYILKENRTYDQILGDLPVGNGDPSLTLYGADVTPNEHKLALEFGVLDNFYDSGEVSGDGHIWSTASTTSDYNEKNWPIAYRGQERTYDADGSVADELPLEHGIPDIDDPGTGFLWDHLAKRGLSYRIYGEFIHGVWCRSEKVSSPQEGTPSALFATCPVSEIRKGEALPANVGHPRGGASPWPWAIPVLKQMRPTKAALRDHYDPKYPDFEVDYPDQLRADEFLSEFDEFVMAKGTSDSTMKKPGVVSQQTPKELPRFILLYLPDDHTGGTRPGKPTPQASVADNDLALGRVVDAVSHSPYWDDTAIFVVEDDAQDGADHVDAHRSIALVISKYSPRREKPFVDHNFYTTVSMIHTIEELLGLPPMNLFDAHAPLMAPLFSGPGTQPPYQGDDSNLRNGLLYQVNGKNAVGARESVKMDFSRPDAADAHKLNDILWRNSKTAH